MATDTDERISKLEARIAELDALLIRIVTAANAHPIGRKILKMVMEAK